MATNRQMTEGSTTGSSVIQKKRYNKQIQNSYILEREYKTCLHSSADPPPYRSRTGQTAGPFTRMHPLTPPFFINYHLLLHPTTCITSTIPSNRTPHHSFVVIVIVSVAMEAVLRLVETPPYYEPPPQHSDSSRPTLGFPLGTALLLIVIFSLSGFFSCCYHWDKLRHLRGASDPDSDDSPSKLNPTFVEKSKTENQSLPVLMPGDRIAKFIALPCPCEPPRWQKIEIVEEAQMPPKPPHIVVPMY